MFVVNITDIYGKEIRVAVSKEVYLVFEESRLQTIREEHERREHLDSRNLENPYVLHELSRGMQSVERAVFTGERWRQFLAVLDDCSPLQRERYLLHVVYGYSCAEIAKMQKCSVHTIQRAVKKTSEKIERLKGVVVFDL